MSYKCCFLLPESLLYPFIKHLLAPNIVIRVNCYVKQTLANIFKQEYLCSSFCEGTTNRASISVGFPAGCALKTHRVPPSPYPLKTSVPTSNSLPLISELSLWLDELVFCVGGTQLTKRPPDDHHLDYPKRVPSIR